MNDTHNNQGGGFFVDDDDDFDSLLNEAAAGEAPDDPEAFDTNFLLEGVDADKIEPEDDAPMVAPKSKPAPDPIVVAEDALVEPAVAQEPEPAEEPIPEEQDMTVEELLEETPVVIETVEAETPAHKDVEPKPEPVYVTPAIEPTSERTAPAARPAFKVPTIEDELARASQVIRILDAYRALTVEERGVTAQFITAGEEIHSEAEFVVRTTNVDPMLAVTMKALKEAKSLEAVDRAFFVIDLREDVLYHLGSLVSVFTGEEIKREAQKSIYAKEVVRNIEKLDGKAMSFVTATESVLNASEAVG